MHRASGQGPIPVHPNPIKFARFQEEWAHTARARQFAPTRGTRHFVATQAISAASPRIRRWITMCILLEVFVSLRGRMGLLEV